MKIEPMTVSELNRYIKEKVATDEMLNNIYIRGEISNFKNHYSGHLYFTLKDEKSLVKCVMFKTSVVTLKFMPKDGMKVRILGTVGVFERDGVYQIYCNLMEEDGIGALYEAYEKLKQKLEEEGLFLEKNKKKIPVIPKAVGILTSQTGSVIKDIINVSTRRNPKVNLKLFPIPVQGKEAAEKISYAIHKINEKKLADVIILARGGGSLEDLWPFNEEIVAYSIFDSEIPIISAVGHETDFTISDFVADLRAPTPSAAAELAVINVDDFIEKINFVKSKLKNLLKRKIELMRLKYEKLADSNVYKYPLKQINEKYLYIDSIVKKLEDKMRFIIKEKRVCLLDKISKLDTLSPLKTLKRGYSITEIDGNIVKESKTLKQNDKITIIFYDGNVEAIIK